MRKQTNNGETPDYETQILIEAAQIASSKAIRSSVALGIAYQVIKDGEVLEVYPDKTFKVLRKIKRLALGIPNLKKGAVLRRK